MLLADTQNAPLALLLLGAAFVILRELVAILWVASIAACRRRELGLAVAFGLLADVGKIDSWTSRVAVLAAFASILAIIINRTGRKETKHDDADNQ